MDNAIEPIDSSGDSGVTVNIRGAKLSLQQFQDIYSEFSSNGDRITNASYKNFIVNYEDIKNLYQRLYHVISNFNPIGQKCDITIHHVESDVRYITSFEKFQTYDRNTTSAISSLNIEYSFVLRSPLNPENKIREYSIEVNLQSGIAFLKKHISDDSFALVSKIFPQPSLYSVVKYHDYGIAISIQSIVNSWRDALSEREVHFLMNFLQKYHEYLSKLVHFVVVVSLTVFFCWMAVETFDVATMDRWSFSALAGGGILGSTVVIDRILFTTINKIQDNFKATKCKSIILINKGDENLKAWYERNQKSWYVKWIGALLFSLFSGTIVAFFTRRILKI